MAYRSCRVNNHDLQLFTDALEGKGLRSLFQGSWEGSALTSQVGEVKQQSKHPGLGQLSTGGGTYNWEDHKCFEKSQWCYRQSINQPGVSLTERGGVRACVCVCVRGALASSCAFLLGQVFKKKFLLGACKFQNLYISRLVDFGRSNHVSQDKSEQRTAWNSVFLHNIINQGSWKALSGIHIKLTANMWRTAFWEKMNALKLNSQEEQKLGCLSAQSISMNSIYNGIPKQRFQSWFCWTSTMWSARSWWLDEAYNVVLALKEFKYSSQLWIHIRFLAVRF